MATPRKRQKHRRVLHYVPDPWRPAKVSNDIRPISELERGRKVVLVCRESSYIQEKDGNLIDQEQGLRGEMKARGVIVAGVHAYVGSGWDPQLERAVAMAKEHGAVLVAETVDRLMRPQDYDSVENPNAMLRERHVRLLRNLTQGVPLYTLEHPDSTPGQNRSRQTRRGQAAKDNRGGRPIQARDAFRAKWLPLAETLAGQGWSRRRIAKEVTRKAGRKISHTAIGNWFKRGAGRV